MTACKYYPICQYRQNSFTCLHEGGDYCGVFRCFARLEDEAKKSMY